MKKKTVFCLGISLYISLLIAGCTKEEKAETPPPAPPPAQTATAAAAQPATAPKMDVKGTDPAVNATLSKEFQDAK